jgi:hypothetical protein
MLAPSFVGVEVPPGQHSVEFRYEPYPDYWLLFLIGVLTLVALAVVPRLWSRRRSARANRDAASAESAAAPSVGV